MKTINIENRSFNLDDITQLYPAAMIKTGFEDELTPISLEWVDGQQNNSEVVIVKYAIFVHTKDKNITSFEYPTREKLEEAILLLSNQL